MFSLDTIDALFIASFIDALAHVVAFGLGAWGALFITWSGLKAIRRIFWIEAEPWKHDLATKLEDVRHRFAQRLVLGLDFFLAGDIILLIISPGRRELVSVAILVLIRCVLSLVVSRELNVTAIVPFRSVGRKIKSSTL